MRVVLKCKLMYRMRTATVNLKVEIHKEAKSGYSPQGPDGRSHNRHGH
jgi:hypothetical protein